jgi:hypothetical protein
MTTPPPTPTMLSSTTVSGPSLRAWGALVFVLFLITSAVGGSLALESSYVIVVLLSHIGLALVTLGVAGYTASRLGPAYRALPRAGAALGAFCALFATVSGAVFLYTSSNAALYAMETLAGIGLIAGLIMMIAGGPSGLHRSG